MTGPATPRVALITGAARGLGRAIAEALAQQGVTLMLVDILADRLEATRAALVAGGASAAAYATDISVKANCAAAVAAAIAQFGRLDILINAAGLMRFNHAADVPEEEFWHLMQVNAAAPFWFAQAAMPHLLASRGNIVNVLSQSALMGTAYIVPYSMSKAALLQLTKSLAVEYEDQPIRINAVAPGAMMTEISASTRPPADADFAKIKRYSGARPPAQPAEVAAVVAFISSPAASAVHGAVWPADCGVTAG
ncbi:SDR family NAD(P)-dependent oxidoreductase [Acidocella sp.]|uniref:SDR family NAD(P)-dependent oxidoreductase n=1 Tax=Acidocella sp. TaxID=50710 RepID=UPI00262A4BCE|nr:SDR family oxidoreductase [Acidocella sp.]